MTLSYIMNWLLRGTGGERQSTSFVPGDGDIGVNCVDVFADRCGVRPMIRICI